MKFLLDACTSSRSLRSTLTQLGHDVLSIVDVDAHASDEKVLDVAHGEDRVLITEDKDFGELVFVRRLSHPAIVRFVEMRVSDQVVAIQDLIEHHASDLEAGAIIVVSIDRIRIRHTELEKDRDRPDAQLE